MKLRLVKELLRHRRDDAVVLFADAFDSVLLPCRDTILGKFRAFEAPIVFSAEKGCWPDPHLKARYPQPESRAMAPQDATLRRLRPTPPLETPFRYLNSGGYMGYAGAIRSVLAELEAPDEDDDQRLFTHYFLEHRETVGLDHESTIFQTLHHVDPDDLTVERGNPVRVRGRLTPTETCVLHGNGDGRGTLATLVARLRSFDWP
jgi:hypothetical protein